MGHLVATAARSIIAACIIAAAACGFAAAQSSDASSQSAAQSNDQPQPEGSSSSSSKTTHRKTDSYTNETIRHIRVREEPSAPPELTQAETLIQKRDYAGAEPLLRKVVQANPSNDEAWSYEAWFDLGFVENGLGNVPESIAAYRKSVAIKPDVFESNLNLGLQLAKTSQPDAEQFLRTATKLKPTGQPAEGLERAWLSLGHVLESAKPEEAIAAYHQAALLQPKDPEPRLSSGALREKENKYSDAVEEYKDALALDPNSDALIGLANVYMRGRQFPEAEEYLHKLVAAQPGNAGAHIELGRVLMAENKNDAALTELKAGAKLAPTDLSAQRDLADLYTTLGKNDQAEAVYRSLLAADPKNAELHRSLGQSLLREKNAPAAQQEFLAAVNLNPNLGEAYGDLAFAASENKDYVLSLKALAARAKFLPEVPTTYFLRASDFDHLKDYKQAAANYHLFLGVANGKFPDQEWQAKHRLITIEPKK
ncbi:MAG TPA: tetratricopeptide repeat protein [Verrucomicrobiae bacterium]|nr:tetratricopeptide repeat protein [Verrucomicrobiae bacterium]